MGNSQYSSGFFFSYFPFLFQLLFCPAYLSLFFFFFVDFFTFNNQFLSIKRAYRLIQLNRLIICYISEKKYPH